MGWGGGALTVIDQGKAERDVSLESERTQFTAAYRIHDEDRGELTETVERHVSEETEGSDQRTPTLTVQIQKHISLHAYIPVTSANIIKMVSCLFFNIPILTLRCFCKHIKGVFPHLISMGTQLMFSDLEVKGDATEASASDRETPTSAALRAPQSLAPSPHMPTR